MEAPEGRTRRVFTYEEARALFPAVRELTAGAVARVESLRASAPAGLSRSAAEADLRSRLEEIVDARKLRFAVEVVSADGRTVGVGTHERRIIGGRRS